MELYPTDAVREQLVATVASNPSIVSFLGPIYGSSVGALTAWRVGTIASVLVGLMASLTVIRNTREEEETGRRELLGSTVLGRHAPLTAALLVAGGAGLAIGGLIAVGLDRHRTPGPRGDRLRGRASPGLRWFLRPRPGWPPSSPRERGPPAASRLVLWDSPSCCE